MTEARFHPPLSADDPRLSEWLDGRLPEVEAVQIARLVATSPELTRLVADLRQQKAALAALPTSPPPARFVEGVLAALDVAGDTADDDAEVEAEWRRIERERLEEEIAEARDDAAAPVAEPMGHRWPWLALAGALAAGVLAAVVINRPGGMGDREVALVAPQQREPSAAKRAAAEARRSDTAADQDTWLPEGAAVSDAVAADRNATTDKVTGLAAGATAPRAAEAGKTLERGRALMEKPAGSPEFGGDAGSEALAANAKARLTPPSAPPAPAAAAAQGEGGAGGEKEPQVRSVTYRIRTAADRERLESLLATSGRVTRELATRELATRELATRELATRELATRELLAKGAEPVQRQAAATPRAHPDAETVRSGPASERIAISGPADAMARLAAALEAAPATESAADAVTTRPGVPAESAAKTAADGEADITLVIVVEDESGGGEQADEGRP
jgi:hypothetical protein